MVPIKLQKMLITITSYQWLDIVYARLEKKVIKWADNTPMIRRMLADNTIERATESNRTKFKETLIAWFDTRATTNEVEIANLALDSLKEGKDKDLCKYYNRTKRFLKKAGKQDFWERNPPQTVSIIELLFLNGVIGGVIVNLTLSLIWSYWVFVKKLQYWHYQGKESPVRCRINECFCIMNLYHSPR